MFSRTLTDSSFCCHLCVSLHVCVPDLEDVKRCCRYLDVIPGGAAGEARLHAENLPGTFQKCSGGNAACVGGTDVTFSLMQPVTYLIYSVISFSTAFCLVV